MRKKIYTNELSHMAALPIYGKNLKKSLPEPLEKCLRLVTQVSDSGPKGPPVFILNLDSPNFIKPNTNIYHYKTLMYVKFDQAGFGSS